MKNRAGYFWHPISDELKVITKSTEEWGGGGGGGVLRIYINHARPTL